MRPAAATQRATIIDLAGVLVLLAQDFAAAAAKYRQAPSIANAEECGRLFGAIGTTLEQIDAGAAAVIEVEAIASEDEA